MRKQMFIIAAVVALVVIAFTYAAPDKSQQRHVGAFTLKKLITTYKGDGATEIQRSIYRRASDGSFRIINTDGKTIFMDRGFSQGRGYFHVDYGSKTLWRDTTQKPDRGPTPIVGPEVYTKDPNYVGTDTIMGYTAYHLRLPGNAEGSVDSDLWLLPELGGVSVREISYRPDGSLRLTEEAYSLEFAEPDPQLVRLPDFAAVDDTRDQKKR